MSDFQNISDLCTAYLSGKMTEDESRAFLNEVNNNPLYKEILENEEIAYNAILENSLIDFRSKMSSYVAKQAQIKKASIIGSVAAVLLVSVASILYFNTETQNTENIFLKETVAVTNKSIEKQIIKKETGIVSKKKKENTEQTKASSKQNPSEKQKKHTVKENPLSEQVNEQPIEIKKTNTSQPLQSNKPKEANTDRKEEKTSEKKDVNKNKTTENKCRNTPRVKISTSNASNNEENGSAYVEAKSTELLFSLDDFAYSTNTQYDYLKAGLHILYIKDTLNCVYKHEFLITHTLCDENSDIIINDAVFDNDISINTAEKGVVTIFSKNEKNIHSQVFSENENVSISKELFLNETSSNYYKIVVQYQNETCMYNITIVK